MAKAGFGAIGKFKVLGTLGEGANSTILHVRREADGGTYALKVVPIADKDDLKFLDQAEHEYEIAQKLDHRNLIKVYALEKRRDWRLRVREVRVLIEHVNGRPLDDFKSFPIAKLVQIFSKVAAGLAHMHRRGVYHADIKPGNILLSREGKVKIIDFGLAWNKGEEKDRVQGTPEYMAPEQVKKKTVNEKTDIFNFGATMYRLTTLRSLPSAAETAGLVSAANWRTMFKPVPQCNREAPRELADLIHDCIAYRPADRPERVLDVKEVLDQLVKKLVRSPGDRLDRES